MLDVMIDSIDQGIMVFGSDGICAPLYSKACAGFLLISPAGRSIDEVLQVDEVLKEEFLSLYKLMFDVDPAISFEQFIELAPKTMKHPEGLILQLTYKPVRSSENLLQQIIVVIADFTQQFRSQALIEEMKAEIEFFDISLRDRQFFGAYMRHAADFSKSLINICGAVSIEQILREAHTLKGGAGLFKARALIDAFHNLEMELKTYRKQEANQSFDNVILGKHGRMVEMEVNRILAMFRDRFSMDVMKYEEEFNEKSIFEFADYLVQHGHHELWREYMLRVCAQSLFAYLRHYNLLIIDLADRFNKKVHQLQIIGHDVLIPLRPYRALFESFVNIFRNVMDHGIETPQERKSLGKDESGLVRVKVSSINTGDSSFIRIDISDDGAGINTGVLREKLVCRYPEEQWQSRSDEEIQNSILSHKLSTRDVVTSYSGQGIGMGAVAQEVIKLGGEIHVHSVQQKGTTLTIEIPFILDALEWDERLAIQTDIDKDHKKLFHIFNMLSSALSSNGNQTRILELMKELVSYTSYHFSREEKLMQEMDYPGLLAHKNQHKVFVNSIKDVYNRYKQEQTNSIAFEALEFIKNWLINHIQKVDRGYAPYIKNPSSEMNTPT